MTTTEAKKSRPTMLMVVTAVFLLAVSAYWSYVAFSGRSTAGSMAYFTVDDGATTFTDRLDLYPPFEHNGKQAVRAWVFTTDEGKTSSVGYLERCTSAAKVRIENELAAYHAGKLKDKPSINSGDTEVKRPRSTEPWVNTSDRAAANKVTHFPSPGSATPDLLLP